MFWIPALISAGYISVPMASNGTVPDPDTAANAAQDMIVAIANPPGIGAVNEVIKSMSRDHPSSRHNISSKYE